MQQDKQDIIDLVVKHCGSVKEFLKEFRVRTDNVSNIASQKYQFINNPTLTLIEVKYFELLQKYNDLIEIHKLLQNKCINLESELILLQNKLNVISEYFKM